MWIWTCRVFAAPGARPSRSPTTHTPSRGRRCRDPARRREPHHSRRTASADAKRVSDRFAWRAARYGSATVFLLDGRAYVETGGSWIVGGAYADFAVVHDRGARIQLFVRNAAIDNTVMLDAGSWRETVTLKPREERQFADPDAANRPGIVLRVQTSTGARPADVEEGI